VRRRERVVHLVVAREVGTGRVGRAVAGDPEPLDVRTAKPEGPTGEKKVCALLRDEGGRESLGLRARREGREQGSGGGGNERQDPSILSRCNETAVGLD